MAEDLAELHGQFLEECRAGHIQFLPITSACFERIETVMRAAPRDSFLRAADTLHLACAAEHGFAEVYSNDRHLLAAAPLFGLRGLNVIGG